MKFVIPGGSGHVGRMLARELEKSGHQVVILTRHSTQKNDLAWDGATLGAWANEIDGADVVLNLAGRTVNCRYTAENLKQMMDSRVDSTRVVGQAIAQAKQPPKVWLQMSTATIYAHRFDAANDEKTGRIGGDEPDAPTYWKKSIDIARAWEQTLAEANTPATRKVALRTAMVMSTVRGSVFDVLSTMTQLGLGGPIAGEGHQYVSWIHEQDFVRAVEFILQRDEIDGAINLASPGPLEQREMMSILRHQWGMPIGLPATALMAEVGAVFLKTDTELVLKSRRVIPTRLLESGFGFNYPDWPSAAKDLVTRHKTPS